MLQKERKKGAEQMMQGMQLIHVAATALQGHGGEYSLRSFYKPAAMPHAGTAAWTIPSPVSICPSVFALHVWLQARPGVL